jgi:hypothetical protein
MMKLKVLVLSFLDFRDIFNDEFIIIMIWYPNE